MSVLVATHQEFERAHFLQQSFLAQAKVLKARLACQQKSMKSNIEQAKA